MNKTENEEEKTVKTEQEAVSQDPPSDKSEESSTPESSVEPNAENGAAKTPDDQKQGKKDFKGTYYNYMPLERNMDLMTDEEYIKNRLDNQINWYDRKSSFNQKRYKMFKKVEIIIAATIPVVTSMGALIQNELLETIMLATAAVAGIILVVINKNLELEDYFRFWKEYRTACEALQYERFLYLTRTEPYDEEDAYPRLVEKVENILSKETQKWQSRIKQSNIPDVNVKKGEMSKIPQVGYIPNRSI